MTPQVNLFHISGHVCVRHGLVDSEDNILILAIQGKHFLILMSFSRVVSTHLVNLSSYLINFTFVSSPIINYGRFVIKEIRPQSVVSPNT